MSADPASAKGAEGKGAGGPGRRSGAGSGGGAGGASKSKTNSIVELIVIVLVAIGLALAIQAWIVKPYRIPSGSMEPTLKVGQRVLVNRIGMHFSGPHVGEIVVFHPPKDAEQQICGPAPHMVTPGGAACA
ncbi:MAG TPA: signal peptidase I, partial [Solirubrobacteraceae bacterium]|nr:signal peptidase I [Solirubrobacteraceae bacterium]